MTPSLRTGSRRASLALAGTAVLTVALLPGLVQLPAVAASAPTAAAVAAEDVVTWGDTVPGLADLDTRGTAGPTTAQQSAVRSLDAVELGWNEFGTPSSILPADGALAEATSSDPVQAARTWLRDNAAVFGLTAAQAADLELVNSQQFAQSDARAVLFRQRFGDLTPALGSSVTVGVANGEIAFASSSITPTDDVPEAATLSPLEGWLNAARDVGRTGVDANAITATVDDVVQGAAGQAASEPWTRLDVPGFAQEQQVRLRALAMADGTVRPVFEANVVDVESGVAFAYTSMVDAVTGDVLHRQNQVEQSAATEPFQGSIDGTECGEPHPFELDDKTRQINVAMSAVNAANDATITLLDPSGTVLASADLLTSPETLMYTAPNPLPAGVYSAQICPFGGTAWLPPTNYAGLVSTSDEARGSTADGNSPAWRMFPANPTPNFSANHTPKNNKIACWRILGRDYCTLPSGSVAQPYGGAWDYSYETDSPTLTTDGNNARTREAWGSPLSPGGGQAPVSPTREYFDEFTDAWNNSTCDPTQLTPGGNDILASVANLFVAHNRMHNYSFSLGFTEQNYNMQQVNVENPGVARDGDPEIGNAQAGALSGGQPSYLGRDNANQITLQDGVPGITNQYLFQPIAGAFYAPCVDGGLDMSIVGHEYTHAISNRMVGGPDEGLTSDQGGAMGESWGDLVGAEYMFAHGYRPGPGNRFAVGSFATGNRQTGIRNFAMNRSPLNFSNLGYDITGPQVHADGEIWSATNWSLRSALVKKWNSQYSYQNEDRQLVCAQGTGRAGPFRPSVCPGNRRWLALMFDAFLLQQGATSFVDARNAMIAADRMRFDGKNRKALWDAFAQRGLGKGAKTTPDSINPKASFASPTARNGKITFRTQGPGKIYVGRFEARANPVADTIKKSRTGPTATLVAGRYEMLFVSAKRGFKRFDLTVKPGKRTVKIRNPRNLAASASGAKVIGASGGSLNAKSLIDGTENTNWGGVNGDGSNVDETSPFVSVDLAGKKHRITRVNVSAMLNPSPPDGSEVPLAADPDSGSRFTALRKFALERCVRRCASDDATWKRFYVSPGNAFPAMKPRPVGPNLIMRSFDVPNVRAAAIRLVAVENQCTGYAGYAGEQDNDPGNNTDCKTGSDRGTIVHAAELQVF